MNSRAHGGVALALLALGCSSSPLHKGGTDALEDFCSGKSPKAVINGAVSKPKVTGALEPYSCCEGASFRVATASFDYKVIVDWSVQVSSSEIFPATIDLANPSQGWRSGVRLTCSSGEVCYPEPDGYYNAGEGWLRVARLETGHFGSGYEMSVCLRLAEPPESPHPILHSFDFFAPDITTPSSY